MKLRIATPKKVNKFCPRCGCDHLEEIEEKGKKYWICPKCKNKWRA